MTKKFYSIAALTVAEIQEKKSLFIAYATPVASEEEAQDFITDIKKQHPDARHHVYAYQIGADQQIKRFTDDKEPAGTAGRPVLDAIDKAGLTNTIIVVVRYFGGILLGSGGLTRAYAKVAVLSLARAQIVKKIPAEKYQITFDYTFSGKIESWLEKSAYPIERKIFEQIISFIILVPRDKVQQMHNDLAEITFGAGSTLHLDEDGYIDVLQEKE
jgi:uncharacterized YigZ family protein